MVALLFNSRIVPQRQPRLEGTAGFSPLGTLV